MIILGIWDGHDAGAVLLEGNAILYAANEERFSRKKLDVGFPLYSVRAACEYTGIKPSDIDAVAVSTSDLGKTVSRMFPILRTQYYLFRRRIIEQPRFERLRRAAKYSLTEHGTNPVTKSISKSFLKKELRRIGLGRCKLFIAEHHQSHASAAAFTSGMNGALVFTLDGLGDGLSGTVSIFDKGEIKRISSISSRDSLGIFFEQVTNLLGMRELEDEGKVMALSDYSYAVPKEKNKMLNFFSVNGLNVKAKYSSSAQYNLLKKILWNCSRENFAYMAQQTLETHAVQLFKNAMHETGIKEICFSGGIASNIKLNMHIKDISKKWSIFPHMGDGGLALGAAMDVNHKLTGVSKYAFNDVYLGQKYDSNEIESTLVKHNLDFEEDKSIARSCGDLIADRNIILWFQGRMEYGPRALGNRSILAPAFDNSAKETLNVMLKKRDWFQPFCPTLLKEEARKFFSDVKGYDKFMTMGYQSKPEVKNRIISVINVDGSARPQMLGKENLRYRTVIERVKKHTGDGIVLNTSFNIHGHPIVNTPSEAVACFLETKSKYLAIGDFLVQNKN